MLVAIWAPFPGPFHTKAAQQLKLGITDNIVVTQWKDTTCFVAENAQHLIRGHEEVARREIFLKVYKYILQACY